MSLNAWCYLGLAAVSLFFLIVVCVQRGALRSLLMFSAMIGVGYVIEAVIYIFLSSYVYYPHIIGHDSYYDSNLGAIDSNALALPVAATLIAAYGWGWRGIAGMIAVFFSIEWLYVELGIYRHNWWRLEYTSAGLIFYFLSGKLIYRWLGRPLKGLRHDLMLFFITGTLLGNLHVIPIMILEVCHFHIGWFESISHDTTAAAFFYYTCASLLITAAVRLDPDRKWLVYAGLAGIFLLSLVVLEKREILDIEIWWYAPYHVLLPCLGYAYALWVSKVLREGQGGEAAKGF